MSLPKVNIALTDELLKGGSFVLTAFGIFVSVWATTSDPSSFVWRYWARYTSSLERKLRPQFIWTKGSTIAGGQAAAMFLMLLAHALVRLSNFVLVVGTVAIIIGPTIWVEKMRRDRVLAIETQLDTTILSLANALKSIPSIGAAFQSVVMVIQDPTRQEFELAVKEMKVGSTLDQALLHMAARIGSRQVDSALSAVLIGRQIGGNLPKVLEQTAATLREMARLEGVVRTKTAEGKAQLWVMALLPAALIYALNMFWQGYFDPLTKSIFGYFLIVVCGGLWIGGILAARKILNVDI
ncbi:type II secretion system F family protein [Pendulispora albinea]|uniref:Type II secretion system F family protein n=1 Tax=Pendulispora albinea TaxID=2741071 RepID=A0ABZ2LW95_9BACT